MIHICFVTNLSCPNCKSFVEVYYPKEQDDNSKPSIQPPSEGVCPEAIDYKGQSPVAIDLETYDPGIKDHGPGWATGNGKVVGVALAWDGFKGYFPIDHDAPGNYDKEVFKRQSARFIKQMPRDRLP